MARGNSMSFVLIITVLMNLSASFCEGRQMRDSKGVIKTFKIGDLEIVDCIDILKQPAFTHPLLLNHEIQMKPSNGTFDMRSGSGHEKYELRRSWHKYGRCPEGSVPIKRTQTTRPAGRFERRQPPSVVSGLSPNHEYAAILLKPTATGTIHGAKATLNVWNPIVKNPQDFSLSQLWLVAGSGDNVNTIEAGWQILPAKSGNEPRIFTFWTSNNYQGKGCYDLECPGFVQINKDTYPGESLENFSVYDGQQTEIHVSIQKDKQSGNWWLTVDGSAVGYWPSSIFTSISNAADFVEWGGEIFHAIFDNNPPQMGSGHLSTDGYKRSSYIRDIKYTDVSGSEINPNRQSFQPMVTSPKCYDLNLHNRIVDHQTQVYLFFGGPGCTI